MLRIYFWSDQYLNSAFDVIFVVFNEETMIKISSIILVVPQKHLKDIPSFLLPKAVIFNCPMQHIELIYDGPI